MSKFRLICAVCGEINNCDASVLAGDLLCGKCEAPIEPDAYDDIVKYRHELDELKRQQKERARQEHRRLKEQRKAEKEQQREHRQREKQEQAKLTREPAITRQENRVPPLTHPLSTMHDPDSNATPAESSNTKVCPFCAEQIATAARKCKHCGEFLDGTAPSPVSKADSRTTSGPERTIWEGHPSALYYLAHWILGVLLLPVFGVGLILIIYAILDQQTKVFTHTTKRVMLKAGIISRSTHEVTLTDIRSINMQQSISERLFGLGTVQIGSAGTAGIEVEFSGIANPAIIRDQIRQSKDQVS